MYQRYTILILHALLAGVALVLAFVLRFDFHPIPEQYLNMLLQTLPIAMAVKVLATEFFGLNNGLWRYASLGDLFRIVQTAVVSTLVFIPIVLLLIGHGYPRGVLALDLILTVALFATPRLLGRQWVREKPLEFFKPSSGIPTLILGAGDAGELALRQLQQQKGKSHRVLGFLDDDLAKKGLSIHGVPILGSSHDAETVISKWNIEILVIAIRDPGKDLLERISQLCAESGVEVRILPTLQDLLTGEIQVKAVRALQLEDLLGREPVKLDPAPVLSALKGKRILVTGAGGSIGSELCRQIARMEPATLCLLDYAENALFNIEQELCETRPSLSLVSSLCDIREANAVQTLFRQFEPDVVFHAAACKHVPMMETHPAEAVRTNVFGTLNVLNAAETQDVTRFLLVSTDKAASPANIMGATKWLAEQLVRDAGVRTGKQFSCVRFGNVLGSQGSVVPLFERQIAQGGPVRVTHEEATRYFMTIPEAVQLILQADALAESGDVFILDMGEPVRIVSLAENLIKLSGFKPNQNMEIRIVGLRPGEKLHEQLTSPREKVIPTAIPKLNRLDLQNAQPLPLSETQLHALLETASAESPDHLSSFLWSLLPDH
jgi:FlaA1/EpsC-like NDP-sugar epimerase